MAREKDVTIGSDCMFSREIEIRSTDVNKIYEWDNDNRLNLPADVVIGDKVWIGARVFVSEGVFIPAECVIGACSFVNKSFTEKLYHRRKPCQFC
ncbi:hypothetical protein [Kushneria sinocarnis]|uniref:hypothetical protein n=1 Tax=Kushneria sinocarnis TaxID=595502 RepID=UPI0011C3C612|nr:hypothetical protein [Kushneria sinocarnis]